MTKNEVGAKGFYQQNKGKLAFKWKRKLSASLKLIN